jgi:hypothetical protein
VRVFVGSAKVSVVVEMRARRSTTGCSPDQERTMKYLMMVKIDPATDEGRRFETGAPPDPRLLAAVGRYAEEMARAGILRGTGGLLPSSRGARVRAAQGRLSVTDGPLSEAKELIGGYAILEAASRERAIELGPQFMQIHVDVLGPAYNGELEIRQMYDDANACGKDVAQSRAQRDR